MQSDIKQYSTLFLRFLDSKNLFMEWGRGLGVERHAVQGGEDGCQEFRESQHLTEAAGCEDISEESLSLPL